MMAAQLGRRAIATRGQIANKDVKSPPNDGAWERAIAAREFFRGLGGKVWVRRLSLDRLVSVARAWRRRTPKPGPVVIDYLQLLEVSGNDRRLDKRGQVELITRTLKLLAMELEVPVILLSQLNRKVEDRDNKRPRSSDLRDSGSIEQDADSIVLLYRPYIYGEGTPLDAEAIISKCREGVPGTTMLRFEGHFSRFLDAAPDDRSAPGMEWRG